MRKIPTLFVRDYSSGKPFLLKPQVTLGYEWVLDGGGIPTVKVDGACTAIINGVYYRRLDAKHRTDVPGGAIPCCDPDPVTGHWPHWVRVNEADKADKWFMEALRNTKTELNNNMTYEAIGPHFQGNPYNLEKDILVEHGSHIITDLTELNFEGIREYLEEHPIEGIVFWKDRESACKIKRTDFKLKWPVPGAYY